MMTRALSVTLVVVVGLASVAVSTAAGCHGSDASTSDDADGGGTGAAGTGLATGLPCDVQALIENRCIACHDGSGAPPALLDYATLTAPSNKDPSKSRAVVAVELMKGLAMPPRPAVPPAPDEIASFEDWVNAGTPRETKPCTDRPPPAPPKPVGPDGGALDAGGIPGCTSGQLWDGGNSPSPLMHPGNACNACHQVSGGPNLRFGGTVYPTGHEPNDCNGAAPPPQLNVTVTDSKSRTFTMAVNEAGNFLLDVTGGGAPPRAPFRASLSDGTKTRSMNGSVTSGDCNSCHTVAGANGAPGRIMAP
jgi:hypothetical protein